MRKSISQMRQIIISFILTYILSSVLWIPGILYSAQIQVPGFLMVVGQFAVLGLAILSFGEASHCRGCEKYVVSFRQPCFGHIAWFMASSAAFYCRYGVGRRRLYMVV